MRQLRYDSAVLVSSLLCLFMLLVAGLPGYVRAQQPESLTKTDRGVLLYKQGFPTGAIDVLNGVVDKDADDAEAWYYLGLAFNSLGRMGASRSPFEHLIRLRPDSADGHAKLAYALILADQPQRALALAKRALELGDQSAEAHFAIAEANLRAGGDSLRNEYLLLAVQEAETTLRINPRFSLALITKSLAHSRLEQYSDSTTSLEQFVALSPNDFDAETWRGQLEEMRQRGAQSTAPQPPVESGRTVTQKVRILSKPEPQYTEAARQAGVQGTVALRAVFTSEGAVKHLRVIRALGFGLTTQAIKAARQIRFTPAMKDNRPVSMYIQLEYNFSLF